MERFILKQPKQSDVKVAFFLIFKMFMWNDWTSALINILLKCYYVGSTYYRYKL